MPKIDTFAVVPHDKIHNGFFQGYYHERYLGFKKPGNPDYLNYLKNLNNKDRNDPILQASMVQVTQIVLKDIPYVIKQAKLDNPTVVCAPRAKASLTHNQMLFREAVNDAVKLLESHYVLHFNDTFVIKRVKDTAIPHMYKPNSPTNLPLPYPGISQDTCVLEHRLDGKDVILVDDIYSATTGYIEDIAQWLKDSGAKSVCIYVLALARLCNDKPFEHTFTYDGEILTTKSNDKYIKLRSVKNQKKRIGVVCVFEDDKDFELVTQKPNQPLNCLISYNPHNAGFYRFEGLADTSK